MTYPESIRECWHDMSDLTIYDAAFWIVHKSDPLLHILRCDTDSEFENYYLDNPYGDEAVCEFSQRIISGIRNHDIKTTKEHLKDDFFDIKRTYISKLDWIRWCGEKGYDDLSNLFEKNDDTDALEVIAHATPESVSNSAPIEIKSTYVPANGVGKKCVKAARHIEMETNIRPTAIQVMELLQKWADAGVEADVLTKSDIELSVIWTTRKSARKKFSLEACEKILKKFNDGRQ